MYINKQELYDKINKSRLRINNYREDLIIQLGKALKNNDNDELDNIYKLSTGLNSIEEELNVLKDKVDSI